MTRDDGGLGAESLDCRPVTERITQSDVEHVAQLARLALTPEEVATYTGHLEAILEHADDIAAIDLTGVPPTAHPVPLENVLRPDAVHRTVDRVEVLTAAPEVEQDRFRVPRILGDAP